MSSARAFKLELTKEWAAKVDDLAEAITGIGMTALRGIVQKTPVDTGRLRGNWITSVSGVVTASLDRTDPSGQAAINEGLRVLGNYPDDMPVIHIQNNLDYGVIIENGWPQINPATGGLMGSPQAPQGMVALTVAEIEAQFDGEEV